MFKSKNCQKCHSYPWGCPKDDSQGHFRANLGKFSAL